MNQTSLAYSGLHPILHRSQQLLLLIQLCRWNGIGQPEANHLHAVRLLKYKFFCIMIHGNNQFIIFQTWTWILQVRLFYSITWLIKLLKNGFGIRMCISPSATIAMTDFAVSGKTTSSFSNNSSRNFTQCLGIRLLNMKYQNIRSDVYLKLNVFYWS